MAKTHKKHKSTRMSAERVKALLRADYEPGRQDKCKLAVFRNKIKPLTGISERTFWRYMQQIEAENEKPADDPNQLKLFD
jgi:hypothetical protein